MVVDNTFMTPLLQKPLDLGADISVQSATKYLGGHADLLGGVAATNDDALAERLWHLQMITGAMLSPTDSYRLLQEVKTLKLRLTQQQKNTIEVINYLEAHPAVKRVLYAVRTASMRRRCTPARRTAWARSSPWSWWTAQTCPPSSKP